MYSVHSLLDDELAVGVEQLGDQRVEASSAAGAVAVHDDDLGRARGLRAAHGRVDLLRVEARGPPRTAASPPVVCSHLTIPATPSMSLMMKTFTAGSLLTPWTRVSRKARARHRRLGRDRLGVRARLRGRGREVVVHYHRGRERAEALAAELGGAPSLGADLTRRGGGRPAVRGGARPAGRRVRRGRRRLAARGRAGLGAAARALGGDARREPDRDVPHRARLPARGRRSAGTAASCSSARPPGSSARPATPTTRPRSRRSQHGLLLSLKNEVVRVAPRARVNAVAPGWTESPMTRGCARRQTLARSRGRWRCARSPSPRTSRAQVVVLASDELSGHVTGQVVTVAGGMEGRVVHDGT